MEEAVGGRVAHNAVGRVQAVVHGSVGIYIGLPGNDGRARGGIGDVNVRYFSGIHRCNEPHGNCSKTNTKTNTQGKKDVANTILCGLFHGRQYKLIVSSFACRRCPSAKNKKAYWRTYYEPLIKKNLKLCGF